MNPFNTRITVSPPTKKSICCTYKRFYLAIQVRVVLVWIKARTSQEYYISVLVLSHIPLTIFFLLLCCFIFSILFNLIFTSFNDIIITFNNQLLSPLTVVLMLTVIKKLKIYFLVFVYFRRCISEINEKAKRIQITQRENTEHVQKKNLMIKIWNNSIQKFIH